MFSSNSFQQQHTILSAGLNALQVHHVNRENNSPTSRHTQLVAYHIIRTARPDDLLMPETYTVHVYSETKAASE